MNDELKREKNRLRAETEKHYIIEGKIGEGTYGVVFIARKRGEHPSAPPVAVKRLKMTRESEGVAVASVREISLLRELCHPNIVSLRDVFLSFAEESRSLSLVIDYADYDLFGILRFHRKQQTRATLATVKSIMYQLLQGVSYLHSNWIAHRDLKPSNILIMGKSSASMEADFGLARIFQSPLRALSNDGVVVTLWYRAPELLLGSRYNPRPVDVWACGCILAELLLSTPLFRGQEDPTPHSFQFSQLLAIYKVLGTPTKADWDDLDSLPHYNRTTDWTKYPPMWQSVFRGMEKEVVDLLMKMLVFDPMKRITAAEALEHEWFKIPPYTSVNVFSADGSPSVRYPSRKVVSV